MRNELLGSFPFIRKVPFFLSSGAKGHIISFDMQVAPADCSWFQGLKWANL